MRRGVALAMAAAMAAPALAVAGAELRGMVQQIAPASPVANASLRYGGIGDTYYRRGRGPGWTCAQVKRMKRKKRNRLRAKGHHRKAVR